MAFADGHSNSPTESQSGVREDFDLPSRLRILCIAPKEPCWVRLTLHLDSAGCHEPCFRWISTSNEALAILRDSSFDCLLIQSPDEVDPRLPEFAAAPLLRAIRASGSDDPIVIFTSSANDELASAVCMEGAELLVTSQGLNSTAVVPIIRRAIQRVETDRENHRLAVADRRRLSHERDEAVRLLEQQRQIIFSLELLASEEVPPRPDKGAISPDPTASSAISLPEELDDYYQELLRTYVIMGSGNLGPEIARLARLLSELGLSPRQSLQLHLGWVERLVRGLGNRSSRHVMSRADLLALELMIHLGECYQQSSSAHFRRAA